jgi:prepilin-type N-terminal cleavage/methylation domain-containing protein
MKKPTNYPSPFQRAAYPQAVSGSCAFGENHGFTLVEIMVAALVMTLLVTNLLGLVVYAAMFRLKARQSSVARAWIQQDLENVKFNAAQFKVANLSADVAVGATSISVNRTSIGGVSIAIGDTLKIGTDSVFHTVSGISGTTITFTPAINIAQVSGVSVLPAGASGTQKFCNATSSTTGLAQALSADLAPVQLSSQTLAGVTYTLNRTVTPINATPYQTLAVAYSVVPSGGGASILSLQTQVVPNAAFSCP